MISSSAWRRSLRFRPFAGGPGYRPRSISPGPTGCIFGGTDGFAGGPAGTIQVSETCSEPHLGQWMIVRSSSRARLGFRTASNELTSTSEGIGQGRADLSPSRRHSHLILSCQRSRTAVSRLSVIGRTTYHREQKENKPLGVVCTTRTQKLGCWPGRDVLPSRLAATL